MKHFAVFLLDLESERFLSATSDQISTWLFLHAFCSKQLNGGTIEGAGALPERFWNRHGIDRKMILEESPLWSWTDGNLSVEPYDIDGQTLYQKKVLGGGKGAEKRWKGTENRTPNSSENRTPNRPNLTLPNPVLPIYTPSAPEGESKKKAKGTLEELRAYAVEIGLPESDGESMFDHWESNGWKNGSNPVKCWKAGIRKWKSQGWLPSQKTNGAKPPAEQATIIGGRTYK